MDIVFTTTAEVLHHLRNDTNCSQDLMDTIIVECVLLTEKGNNFNLISIDNSVLAEDNEEGYILDEFENMEDEPIKVTKFLYEDF